MYRGPSSNLTHCSTLDILEDLSVTGGSHGAHVTGGMTPSELETQSLVHKIHGSVRLVIDQTKEYFRIHITTPDT